MTNKRSFKNLISFVSSLFNLSKQLPPIPNLDQLHSEWMMLANKGQYQEAISHCLEQTKKKEKSFLVTSFLGYAFHQINDYKSAVTHLTSAIKQQPDDFFTHYFLASSLRALGNKSEALLYFTRAWEIDPHHVNNPLYQAISLVVACEGTVEMTDFIHKFKIWVAQNPASTAQWQSLLLALGRFDELQKNLSTSLLPKENQLQFRRICSVSQWVSEHEGAFQTLGNTETIRIVHPTNYDATEKERKEQIVFSNIPYIAELPQATIVGGSSLIFAGNDYVLSDTLAHPQYGRYASLQYDTQVIAQHPAALLVKNNKGNLSLPEGIMLSGLCSNAYGHWFAEFLPKLSYLEQHPRFSEIPIIVDEGMPSSHYEFLHALAKNPLHVLPKGCCLEVGRLLVAPTLTFFPIELFPNHNIPGEHQGSWTSSALRYLKNKVLDYSPIEKVATSERFFLSRKKSTWRRLLNEEEIINLLQPLGFKVIFLEDHSFQEQVRLFQRAEFIVAPNGSTLNNLIFAQTHVKLLVLAQEEHFNWGGWLGPMMELGYSPQFLSGKRAGKNSEKHADYFIQPDRVLKAVIALGNLK